MTVYVQEPIDIDDVKTLLEDNWDSRNNTEIPQPTFYISDRPRTEGILDSEVAYVNLQAQPIEETQSALPYQHANQRLSIVADIWTRRVTATNGGTGRQYLHDIKQEMRRILYANKHSLTNWHLIRYQSFEDVYEDSIGGTSGAGRFHGRMRFTLENDSIATATELVAEDLFTRSDGAIGADWTDVAGTWEVVSNQAALQSATANAHTRFVRSGITLKAQHRLQVDLVTAASMEAGLLFRWSDSSNYWTARLLESGGTRSVRLVRTTAGVDLVVGDVVARSGGAPNWANGDTVELAVGFIGTQICVRVDGLDTIRVTDASFQSETDHGLFSDSDQTTRFDNFGVFEFGGSAR